MNISITTDEVDSYFQLVRNWDYRAKKKLIVRLVESLEPTATTDFSACFGAWQDDREAEDIVREIEHARQNVRDIEAF